MPVNTFQVANVVMQDTFTQFANKTNEVISIVNGLPSTISGAINRAGGTIDGDTTGSISQGASSGSLFIIGTGPNRGLAIGDFLTGSFPTDVGTDQIHILKTDATTSAGINVTSTVAYANVAIRGLGSKGSTIRLLEDHDEGMVIHYDGNGTDKLNIKDLPAGGAEVDRFTFTRAGALGIGITDPNKKLHIYSAADWVAKFESTDNFAGILLKDDEDNHWGIASENEKLIFRYVDSSDAGIAPNSGNRITVYPSGYVGLGTQTAPQKHLDIQDAKNATIRFSSTKNDGGADDWTLTDTIGTIEFWGEDASGGYGSTVRGFIKSISEATAGNLWGLSFGTSTNNNAAVEHLRIDSDGNVGIGTTDPKVSLHVDGGTDIGTGLGDSVGFLVLGDTASHNLVLDNNEIQSRNNGAASPIYIQKQGGHFHIGDNVYGSGGDQYTLTSKGGKIGIGIDNPVQTLHVVGSFQSTGAATIGGTLGVTGTTTLDADLSVGTTLDVTGATTLDDLTVGGTISDGSGTGLASQVLSSTGSGGVQWSSLASLGGGVGGSGTNGRIAMWTSSGDIDNALIDDNGSTISIFASRRFRVWNSGTTIAAPAIYTPGIISTLAGASFGGTTNVSNFTAGSGSIRVHNPTTDESETRYGACTEIAQLNSPENWIHWRTIISSSGNNFAIDTNYPNGDTPWDGNDSITSRYFNIDQDGKVTISPGSDGSPTPVVVASQSRLTVNGGITLSERSAVEGNSAELGKAGQLWVKNTNPTELWFTDDQGNDIGPIGSVPGGSGGAPMEITSTIYGPADSVTGIASFATGGVVTAHDRGTTPKLVQNFLRFNLDSVTMTSTETNDRHVHTALGYVDGDMFSLTTHPTGENNASGIYTIANSSHIVTTWGKLGATYYGLTLPATGFGKLAAGQEATEKLMDSANENYFENFGKGSGTRTSLPISTSYVELVSYVWF